MEMKIPSGAGTTPNQNPNFHIKPLPPHGKSHLDIYCHLPHCIHVYVRKPVLLSPFLIGGIRRNLLERRYDAPALILSRKKVYLETMSTLWDNGARKMRLPSSSTRQEWRTPPPPLSTRTKPGATTVIADG